jgi:glyoxylase-like metal-dependent hydrolase (beta-lactamase superfamily II)
MSDIKLKLTEFDHGITAIDTGYVRPRFDASHLIVRGGRAAFVDTGTTHSVSILLDALEAKNIDRGDVDYVFLTHVHLDHAGGAGALSQVLPNAKVLVHPRGARHIIDPAKLVAGTKTVYGEKRFNELYGDIPPVPAGRVVEVKDGEVAHLNGSILELIHTPGHALHHYSIVDHDSNSIFTGDTFGVSYRVFDTENGAFIMPTTTPVHFDPDQAHTSIQRIMSYRPQAVFVTHYSRVAELERLAADMHRRLDTFVAIAKRCDDNEGDARIGCIKQGMHKYLVAELDQHGCNLDQEVRDKWLTMDIDLNAQGLVVWLNRTRR